jgi:hypothetical protein
MATSDKFDTRDQSAASIERVYTLLFQNSIHCLRITSFETE